MRRPHVYERSAPRPGRIACDEPANQAAIARTISAQLGTMVDKAAGADLGALADLLEAARLEAEAIAVPFTDEHFKPIGPATDAIERMQSDIAEDRAK